MLQDAFEVFVTERPFVHFFVILNAEHDHIILAATCVDVERAQLYVFYQVCTV